MVMPGFLWQIVAVVVLATLAWFVVDGFLRSVPL
jgi:hypothetical protein